MNNIYFPAHVAVLLRRIANVFGTLSLSNQYLLLKQAKVEDIGSGHLGSHGGSTDPRSGESNDWPVLKRLRTMEWPRWRDLTGTGDDLLQSSVIGIPWLTRERKWNWATLIPLPASGHDELESRNMNTGLRPSNHNHSSPHQPSNHPRHPPPTPDHPPADTIHQLLINPTLYNPLRAPRYPLVLCHGLYGFDVRGPSSFPSLRVHYWSNILSILRDTIGAEVIVTSVPGTGSIVSRAETLNKQLEVKARGRGVNFLAHSMGGLDCRHLITHIKPEEYTPLSLTTVSTPHRGSPFMDWCAEYIGIGKLQKAEHHAAPPVQSVLSEKSSPSTSGSSSAPPPPSGSSASSIPLSLSLSSLPSSFTTLILSVVDSPAYANLTTTYLNTVFNPSTPNDPRVKYFSVASRLDSVSVWHPFWLPKMVCDGVEERERGRLKGVWESRLEGEGGWHPSLGDDVSVWAREREWGNDGLVTVQSAKWGEFLGIMEGCDHWEMRGARGLELDLASIANGTEGWSMKDWGRFIGAWKKEEKLHQDTVTMSGVSSDATKDPPSTVRGHSRQKDGERVRGSERDQDDVVIKASTDKLSAVFDWLVDQVPTPPIILGGKEKKVKREVHHELQSEGIRSVIDIDANPGSPLRASTAKAKTKKDAKRNELQTKEDLERFYVALSRKLYDEGL